MDYVNFKKYQVVWSNLEIKVENLDIGKLETAPVDLRKLSNLVKNEVVKKTEYD